MNEWQKKNYLELINWLYYTVGEGFGGDGDATWYAGEPVKNLYPILKEFNDAQKFPWTLTLEENEISWGDNQEWINISNIIEPVDKYGHSGPVIYY